MRHAQLWVLGQRIVEEKSPNFKPRMAQRLTTVDSYAADSVWESGGKEKQLNYEKCISLKFLLT